MDPVGVVKKALLKDDRIYEVTHYGAVQCMVWVKSIIGISERHGNVLSGEREIDRYLAQRNLFFRS